MKIFHILAIILLFYNCSFDNKTGIWKNEVSILEDNKNLFKEFNKISYTKSSHNKIIPVKDNYNFQIPRAVISKDWKDVFYKKDNNFINFKYIDKNEIVSKSKKLSRHKVDQNLLIEDGNLLVNDNKGNIVIYSISDRRIISKFNFYKKKYKKIKKKLFMIVDRGVLYVGDNIGYIYALDYKNNKILWAQNYKIPFRSNIKILNNKIIISNEKNSLLFLNKNDGNLLGLIPTEETILHNNFINNLSIYNNEILFLNSYGSLYSVNSEKMKLNWFVNLNQSTDVDGTNLFYGNKIVNHNNKIMISTNKDTYFIDAINGTIKKKFNFSSFIKPILTDKYGLIITKNNYLIMIDTNTYKIIYSYDITKEVAQFLKSKKTNDLIFDELMMINNNIIVFLKNSFTLRFNLFGELKYIKKLPVKINSNPIISNQLILYLSRKNKLISVN